MTNIQLINSLKSPDDEAAIAAAQSLARSGDSAAIPPMLAVLSSKTASNRVRTAVAAALGVLPSPDTLAGLCEILANRRNDTFARILAASALEELGDPAALPALRQVSTDNDMLRTMLTRAINACLPGDYSPPLDEAAAKTEVEQCILDLSGDGPEVRRRAARRLGLLGDPIAVKPLAAALGDDDLDTCRAAIQALGAIGDPSAVEPLVNALPDVTSNTAAIIGDALVSIAEHTADVRAGLIQLLSAHDIWRVRTRVAVVLGKLRYAEAIPALEHAACNDKKNIVRKTAMFAIANIAGPPAADALQRLQKHPTWQIRKYAAQAVHRLVDVDEGTVAAMLHRVQTDAVWQVRREIETSPQRKWRVA